MAGRHTFTALYEVDHHWDFEEGTGSTAADSVGGATGTLNADAGWNGSGQVGSDCLTLDGTGDYVNASATQPTSITVSMWTKRAAAGVNGQLFDNGDFTTADERGITFLWVSDNTISVAIGNGDATALATTATWADTAWHLVTITHTGSTTSIYVDGALSKSGTTRTISYGPFAGVDTFIGRTKAAGNFFNGLIDDVRIYDHSINEPERLLLANYIGDQ